MTDNEKAAMYIGWNYERCPECWPPDDHAINPAPDMSLPENYMRALEGLKEHGYFWFIASHLDKSVQTKIWRATSPPQSLPPQADASTATLMALAALYDKEHPE